MTKKGGPEDKVEREREREREKESESERSLLTINR